MIQNDQKLRYGTHTSVFFSNAAYFANVLIEYQTSLTVCHKYSLDFIFINNFSDVSTYCYIGNTSLLLILI